MQGRATSARASSAQAHIIQVERKRRGREAAPSFVQPAAFDHVHEVVHALWHLPAQAVDVMLGVDPRGRRLEPPLEVLLQRWTIEVDTAPRCQRNMCLDRYVMQFNVVRCKGLLCHAWLFATLRAAVQCNAMCGTDKAEPTSQ